MIHQFIWYNFKKKPENIKYLGIIIDQRLKWDSHIDNLIIKMKKLNYFYINSRKILDKQISVYGRILCHDSVILTIWHYGL